MVYPNYLVQPLSNTVEMTKIRVRSEQPISEIWSVFGKGM